jgi:hypothetical protein
MPEPESKAALVAKPPGGRMSPAPLPKVSAGDLLDAVQHLTGLAPVAEQVKHAGVA